MSETGQSRPPIDAIDAAVAATGVFEPAAANAAGPDAASMPLTAPRSLRALALALVALGHSLALLVWLAGHGAWALALLIASHGLVLWGTLHPHSRLFGPVLRRLPDTAPVVWLTFDDGPSADTPALLDLLDGHQARATFFLVAGRAAARPDLVAQIVSRGHRIGNHTANHPAGGFWLPRPWATRRQISDAQDQLAALAGAPPRWFRAVAGHANPFVQPTLARLGLARVSWSGRGFDAVDGDDGRVLTRLYRAIAPGAILLLHEGGPPGRAPRLLAALLGELDRRGYGTVLPEPAVAVMPAPLPPLPSLADLPALAVSTLAPDRVTPPVPGPTTASPPHPPAPVAMVSPAAPCPDSGSRPDRTPA